MRVVWTNHRDLRHPRAGGAERTLHEVSRRLVARGNEVTVLSCRWPGCSPKETIDGVNVIRMAGPALSHAVYPITLASVRPVDVVLDDLAHVVPWGTPWLTSTPSLAFFRHLHARSLSGQVSRPLAAGLTAVERTYPIMYRNQPFVTESSTSTDDLLELGIRREQIARIPPGVDAHAIQPGERAPSPRLIWFGRMLPYKRPEHAVMAIAVLRTRHIEAELLVVGDGPARAPAEEMAARLGVRDRVKFLGRADDATLRQAVSSSWVNIHTSVTEGWALAAMEAAAAGVPTVGYRVPGLIDSVEDGVSGILVPDGSPDSLADGIARVIDSPQQWRSACVARAALFDWEPCSVRWENALKAVANRGPWPPKDSN